MSRFQVLTSLKIISQAIGKKLNYVLPMLLCYYFQFAINDKKRAND